MAQAESKGMIIFEAFLTDLFATILNFLTAWIVMLVWGAFVSESGFNLPTLSYWAVFFGTLFVQQVSSIAFYSINLRLSKVEQALKNS